MLNLSDIKPIGDLVLVQRLSQARIGLIYLPDEKLEQSYWVKVLAVGPGRLGTNGVRNKVRAEVGKTYFCRQYSGYRLDPLKEWKSPQIVPDQSLELEIDEELLEGYE